MAVVSTVDVITNPNTSLETIKNGVTVTSCLATGQHFVTDINTDTNFVTFETSVTYEDLETILTSRFDDIEYYNAVDGGTP
jgi:hypothetical protein